MTDNEIIEFLEIHQKRKCSKCPNNRSQMICSDALTTAALELIYRQQEKIDDLEASVESLCMEIEEGYCDE